MRKISTFLFAASFAFLGLTSCSSDDSSSPEPQPTDVLLGKWNLQTVSVKVSVDGEVVQEVKDQPISPVVMTFDFKADSKVEYFYYEPATAEEQEYEEKLSGTYKKEGNKLTITIEDEPGDFTILLNDKSNLHLGMSFEETYEGMVIKQETEQKFVKM